jgi:hypothetical protein
MNREFQRDEVCKIYPDPKKAQQRQEKLIRKCHTHSSTGNAGASGPLENNLPQEVLL